jgi:hypothetical protein
MEKSLFQMAAVLWLEGGALPYTQARMGASMSDST